MKGMEFLFFAVAFLPVAFILMYVPLLTRKTESFGVSMEEKYYNDPEIRAMRRSYTIWVGAAGAVILIAACALYYSRLFEEPSFLFPTGILLLILVQTAVYLKFHFRMKDLKRKRHLLSPEMQQVVIDTKFYQMKKTFSHLWFVPHLVLALLTAGVSLLYYGSFPDRIVLQVDLGGNPANIVDKNYFNVLLPFIVQVFLIVVFWIANIAISRSKQQLDAADPQASLQRNIAFRRAWSAYLIATAFLMVLLFTVVMLQMLLQFEMAIVLSVGLGVVAVTLIGAMVLSFRTGQGGSRIQIKGAAAENGGGAVGGNPSASPVNRDDDRYWILGQIYWNPADPALFVEKRFGVGFTVNFARPLAWLVLFGPLLVLLLVLWLG